MNAGPQSVEDILSHAVEIASTHQRQEYIRQSCAGRDNVRREVERLVKHHFAAGKFLDEPTDVRESTVIGSCEDKPDFILGRYKLLERIGEGGFGTVFRAEQREPVRRFVALKVLKPGMNTREVVRRFEAERQALALMDHPHIARVFDAGSTENGHPFFVMELVKGIPITEYADRSHLATPDRLNLFAKVCRAVQHAHQKGIIHRDIKPSNVLVSMHEGTPVPKVIDFGVAKAINQQLTVATVHTQFAQMVGTPLYMSPEQAEMTPLEVDTRSDIYSLGVLLYELLTGTTPFERERFAQASFDELRRIIREEEPPLPSPRLSTLGNLSDTVAELRRTDHRRLTHLIRGELDWIVMKALEKDRTRRYESADGMARDIDRYLHNEPVEACPPSTMYRVRKFIRRNRVALTSMAAVLLLIISGLSISTLLIAKERDAARQSERDASESAELASLAANAAREAESQARTEMNAAVNQRNLALDNLYFAHIQLAHRDWDAGQIGRMRELLDAHVPEAGETDRRGWEWHYLQSICHRDKNTLQGHTAGVMGLCQSPDGKRVASSSSDFSVRLWDVEAGRETAVLRGHQKDVDCIAWSPQGQRIVSGGYDGRVIIWDAETGTKSHEFQYGDCVFAVACSPDGNTIAAGGSFPARESGEKRVEGAVILWDAVDGKKLRTLIPEDQCEMVRALAWSRDGKYIFSGENFHGLVRVWEAATGKLVTTISAHQHHATFIACSPDGKLFASTSLDQTWKVWEIETWKNLCSVVEAHRGVVQCVDWSPDSQKLITAGEDGLLKIWDARSGKELQAVRGHRGPATSVCWSPDARYVVSGSGDKTIKQWDLKIEQGPRTLNADWLAAWNPDGHLLAARAKSQKGEPKAIVIFEAATGTLLARLPYEGAQSLVGISWSPDGRRIAAGLAEPGGICVWDVVTRQVTLKAPAHGTEARSVHWSPDSRWLVSSGVDRQIHVWSIESGKIAHTLMGHNVQIGSVRFHPAGKLIASASWEREVKIWEWETGRCVHDLKRPGAFVADGQSSLAWSPRGDLLAGGSSNGEILIWNSETGREEATLHGHTSHLRAVAWSPDGKRLASGGFDRFVKIWDAKSGRELLSLAGHRSIINCIAWSPDGTRLLTADGAGIKTWDPAPAATSTQ